MIAVLVSFQYGDDFDKDRVVRVASDAAPMFRGMRGVVFKYFTVDDAARRVVNLYLWESRQAAEQFFNEDLRAMVVELYGVEPEISYLEVLEVVDNVAAVAAAH
jgi:heme-degrading monooxygenase HmoA